MQRDQVLYLLTNYHSLWENYFAVKWHILQGNLSQHLSYYLVPHSMEQLHSICILVLENS